MAKIHIPNDTTQTTHEAIDTSQPGDELIFDAGTYTFDRTVYVKNDREYWIVNQYLYASASFNGAYLIEPEESAEHYAIVGCFIDTHGTCSAIVTNISGSFIDNIISGTMGINIS